MKSIGQDKLTEIKKLYICGFSGNNISQILDITKSTVNKNLRKAGIPKHNGGFWTDKEWLYEKYFDESLTPDEIAQICNVHIDTIRRNLRKYNFSKPKKLTEEHKRKISPIGRNHTEGTKEKIRLAQLGEKGHNWNGGKIPEGYKSPWKQQRLRTLERDKYTCQMCGNSSKNKYIIDVHHRIPQRCFKKSEDSSNLDNLVTLCRPCHRIEEAKKTIVNVKIGRNCIIWNYTNLYNVELGDDVKIGAFTEIGNVKIGNRVSIGASSFIPEGIIIEDDVFIAPRFCGTNDRFPPSKKENWEKTLIKKGARIGASVTLLCGIEIGRGARIGAGSVVTKNVPAYEIWVGNPAIKLKDV